MASALIGYSGFVGTTLLKQTSFTDQYRSTDIETIAGRSFELTVCAGAPAQKWLANREPEADRKKIEALMRHLDSIQSERFVLVSTVDVFKSPIGVDETTAVDESGLHPYGLHRRMLERYVAQRFPDHLIVRLPGLVGPGLRKNIIFDFLNRNGIDSIDSRSVFQFYPMVNLWYDIQIAMRAQHRLIHLTAAPISVAEIASAGFGRHFDQATVNPPAVYDLRSIHAAAFGGQQGYQYSKRDTVQAIRAYAQSEPGAKNGREVN